MTARALAIAALRARALAPRLLLVRRMAGWNKPVSVGTVVVVLGVAGLQVYKQHERDEQRKDALRALDDLPAPTSYKMAKTNPSELQPSFDHFDPAALLHQLQGVWLYDDEILAFDGDQLTESTPDGTSTWTVTVVSPCTLDLQHGDKGHARAFTITPDGPRFDVMDGRDGDPVVLCQRTEVAIVHGHDCHYWTRLVTGKWERESGDCIATADGPAPHRSIAAMIGSGKVKLLDNRGDALTASGAPAAPARRFATIDEAKRAQAAGRFTDVAAIGRDYQTNQAGTPVALDVYVVDVDRAEKLIMLGDRAKQGANDPELLCDLDPHGPRHHRGDRLHLSGTLNGRMDAEIEVDGCKLTPAAARDPHQMR